MCFLGFDKNEVDDATNTYDNVRYDDEGSDDYATDEEKWRESNYFSICLSIQV